MLFHRYDVVVAWRRGLVTVNRGKMQLVVVVMLLSGQSSIVVWDMRCSLQPLASSC